jgi:hypothetical protein
VIVAGTVVVPESFADSCVGLEKDMFIGFLESLEGSFECQFGDCEAYLLGL